MNRLKNIMAEPAPAHMDWQGGIGRLKRERDAAAADLADALAALTALREAVKAWEVAKQEHDRMKGKSVQSLATYSRYYKAEQAMLRLANATTTGDPDHADQV